MFSEYSFQVCGVCPRQRAMHLPHPISTLVFSAACELLLFSRLSGFRNCGDSVSEVETRTVSWGFSSWNSSGWKFGHWNWGYCSNVWYFHSSWLLAVSSSPEAMLKRYLNRTKTQVTPEFCSWCFRLEDTRTSPMVMIWWDFSKKKPKKKPSINLTLFLEMCIFASQLCWHCELMFNPGRKKDEVHGEHNRIWKPPPIHPSRKLNEYKYQPCEWCPALACFVLRDGRCP